MDPNNVDPRIKEKLPSMLIYAAISIMITFIISVININKTVAGLEGFREFTVHVFVIGILLPIILLISPTTKHII